MSGIGVAGIVQSHRDFACYYAAEWVKRGIGCYFDNSFPIRAYDLQLRDYYRRRSGGAKDSCWSEEMKAVVGREARPHMRAFLAGRGFGMK